MLRELDIGNQTDRENTMARPRLKKYKDLPPNLVYDITNKQYRYRRPDNRKYTLMGRERCRAVSAAKQLNSLLMPGQDLVAKVMGASPSFKQFIQERFITTILPERKLSKKTLEDYHYQLKYICRALGDKPIDKISVKDIADFLLKYPPTRSNHYRSLLSLIFTYAIAEGLRENNPASSTIKRKIEKTRRRLSIEGYRAIYVVADDWLKNAMDLALLTLQRREDIVNMKRQDIEGDYDILYVIQRKTEKHGSASHIKIKIGNELKKVLMRCCDNIISPYIVHRLPDRLVRSKEKAHHTQILPGFLSKEFAKARGQCGYFKKTPEIGRPSFHEIRSLGIKLYEDQGVDAQKLAGHTDRKMTEQYKAGHGLEWNDAVADLQIVNLGS